MYCNRPFCDFNEMNHRMVENYNNIVDDNDTVIHLGDLGVNLVHHMKEFRNILKFLKGNKILLKGNHDNLPDRFYRSVGFETIGNYLKIGEYFLSHYPLFPDSKWCTEPEFRMIDIFERTNCTKIVHGHSHNNVKEWKDSLFRINACVEVNDYKPLQLL